MPLQNVFRVFVDRDHELGKVGTRPPRRYALNEEEVEVFTDGSCFDNGLRNARAGSGVWFGPGDSRNAGVRVPGEVQSNQAAEVFAVTLAASKTPPFAPLHIVSDSRYAIDGLTQHLPKWEARGWLGVANAALFQEAAADLRARSAPTTFRWVKGHANITGNEEADKLAKAGAEQGAVYLPWRLPPPSKFLMKGAALSKLTQSLAYKSIRKRKGIPERRLTKATVDLALSAVKDATGRELGPTDLWMGLRKDPVQRKVRDFLWKALHEAYKVGSFWSRIPTMSDRGVCRTCDATESMDHILVHCDAPGRQLIWGLARGLLAKRRISLPSMTHGLALGGHLMHVATNQEKIDGGGTRLLRLVVSESAYCIWVMRCERVIAWSDQPNRRHSDAEIRGRWLAAMNKRLKMDVAATRTKAPRGRALPREKVLRTWASLVRGHEAAMDDWIDVPGVLVGMPPVCMRDEG
ncbi:ribonuclease H-like protein [Trametes cingulata]|nr:ribonuclease H-like protein [Trametes cingulata]